MKHFIILVAVFLCGLYAFDGWFGGSSEKEKRSEQRAVQLESQLHQQQEKIDTWRAAAFSLGVGCVVVLIIGTAIGSKPEIPIYASVVHDYE